MQETAYKQFIFPNDANKLHDFVMAAMKFIIENKTLEYGGDLISRIRLILIELLTNGIKHSGIEFVELTIALNKNELNIYKHDKGKPLSLLSANLEAIDFPLPIINYNKTFKVYFDNLTCLYASINNNGGVTFHTEDYDFENADLSGDFLEHYGLVIVAKSSTTFTYTYNLADQSNSYHVSINLIDIQNTDQPIKKY